MFKSLMSAVFAVLVFALPVCVAENEPEPKADSTPVNVVLRFHNGSIVQPAVLLDAVEMETKLGKLTIAAKEVRRIDFGFRLSEEDAKKLEKALLDLGDDKFQLREAASKTLTAMGRLAYPALLERQKNGDLETTKRMATILKDIRERVPADRLQHRKTDVVRTSDSSVAGQITSTSFRVRCEMFGEVKIPVVQLRGLNSLLPGSEVATSVDSAKYGNRTTWMETEFEVTPGSRLVVNATGEINLDPRNQLGNNAHAIKPDGLPGLGVEQGTNFVHGQLLGRIGTDGPTFVIGSKYSGAPEREGKLYLRIVTYESSNVIYKAEGAFQVRISSE